MSTYLILLIKFNIKVYEVICTYSIWNLIYAIFNFNMDQSVDKREGFQIL